jgi:predicted PurR-regulated permease PerM
MISLSAAATVILTLIVAGLVFWLLWWLVDYCGLPEPFNKIAHVILAVLAVAVLIGILLSIVGGQPVFRP